MRKIHIISALFAFALLGTSCEKAFMEKEPSNDPVTTFEYLWDVVDRQ